MKKLILPFYICLLLLAGCTKQGNLGADKTSDNLKLKADKEDIIFSQEKDDEVQYLYKTNKEVPAETNEIIEMRTKNAQFFNKSDGKMKGKFYAGEPFYKKNNKWYQTETATTTKKIFEENISFGGSGDPIYSGAGDGEAYKLSTGYPTQAIWDTAHDDVGGGSGYVGAYAEIITRIDGINGYTLPSRVFVPINTSALGASAVITSAVLSVYINEKTDNYNGDGYDYVAVVETFQANTSSLVDEDYEDCGYDVGNETGGRAKYLAVKGSADVDITGITASQYNDFTLNATGIGWINKTGVTKLGFREGHDIEDVWPGDPGANNKVSKVRIATSEETSTDKDPYITIEYTVSAASSVPAQIINFE